MDLTADQIDKAALDRIFTTVQEKNAGKLSLAPKKAPKKVPWSTQKMQM